jgi:sulfur-oxidizing protein SoxX
MQMRLSIGVAFALLAVSPVDAARAAEPVKEHPGKAIAYDSARGNCLACHAMPTLADAEQPGNSGPPLIAMSARFPDRKVLRAKIWDATESDANSFMPPYGKHKVLSEEEINHLVDFIYGL